MTLPANATCKNVFLSNFLDTVGLDIGSTMSVTSLKVNQAKAVIKNGTLVDKTHLVVNNGSLGLVSAIAAVNQYPSLADSIGFKIGAGSMLQMANSTLLIMGNKNVFGFPALYLDETATISTLNGDFSIYQPFAGSPSMKYFYFWQSHHQRGIFMPSTISASQKYGL